MGLEIQLPALPGGAARVLRWLVAEGEAVAQGAPLLIVLTERAEMLLPAPAAGRLVDPLAAGGRAEPGGALGRLEQPLDIVAEAPKAAIAPRRGAPATPLARAIALDRGVELAALRGSGAGGRVLARDVRAQLEDSRQPIAAQAESLHPAPHQAPPLASATFAFDAGAALARARASAAAFAQLGLRVGLTACVVEAAAALLPAHPLLNAAWYGEGAQPATREPEAGGGALLLRRRCHLAVGEPAGGGAGLRWALVRDAGDLTLRGVARALARPGAPEGATFAVVSLAEGAGWQSAAPPLPGTAAALSVGAPGASVVARGAGLALRPMATLTLCYDARVLDHSAAAAFLRALCRALEAV